MRFLVTGGAGYIGSHVCVVLVEAGHEVTVVDNFSTGAQHNIDAIRDVTGQSVTCIRADIRDRDRIREALGMSRYDAVLHLAALKSVSDSLRHPERYEDVNVRGTAVLIDETVRAGIARFVFVSSAAVYGQRTVARLSEADVPVPSTPYAHSKWAAEQLLHETARTRSGFRSCILRCFNLVGSHCSGRLANHGLLPTDLLSNILLARQSGKAVDVFGLDYDTPDRSAIRDFTHVMDVAEGCVAAASPSLASDESIAEPTTINLGTGRGTSVLNLIDALGRIGGRSIRWIERPRRAGDIAMSIADPTISRRLLNWQAHRSLETACADSLRSFEKSLR